MKAAVLHQAKNPPTMGDLRVDNPQAHDVLIRTAGRGVVFS